jgi:hypothetical protein
MEREEDRFDLDDDFAAGSEEVPQEYDRLIDRANDKRLRAVKRGKAAWSRLEEVLADRRLAKELDDFDYEV